MGNKKNKRNRREKNNHQERFRFEIKLPIDYYRKLLFFQNLIQKSTGVEVNEQSLVESLVITGLNQIIEENIPIEEY